MFNFFKKRKPEEPKPDPEWLKIQQEYQERRKREMELLQRIQMRRYHSADMQRQLEQHAQASNTHHETALALVQQPPRLPHTSALNLPAIKTALQQVQHPIIRCYNNKLAGESIFQFFNKCIFHFFQVTGSMPHTIYYPLLHTLPEYDQSLFTLLQDPHSYTCRFGTFRLVEERRLINQIALEASHG
jgi:hypothetical protein